LSVHLGPIGSARVFARAPRRGAKRVGETPAGMILINRAIASFRFVGRRRVWVDWIHNRRRRRWSFWFNWER